jgi:hypothetical protein
MRVKQGCYNLRMVSGANALKPLRGDLAVIAKGRHAPLFAFMWLDVTESVVVEP